MTHLTIKTHVWAVAAALGAMGTLSGGALAQDSYPAKPVKLVVGYSAGGATDLSARMMADALSRSLGQSFIVENKPGANSNIGAEMVVRAPADGYTLFVGSISTTINQAVYKLGFNAGRDLVPVAQLNVVPNILAVHPSLPVNNVAEFVAYAKKRPGQLSCASPGNGSSAHLGCELLQLRAGIELLHVPYKGSGPAVSDLLGGQVSAMLDNMPPLLPQIRSGKLKGLAVSTAQRVPFAADIPTMQEAGVPDFDVAAWFAVFAPAGTPEAVVNKLNSSINDALKNNADIKNKYAQNGFLMPAGDNSAASFKAFFQSEIARWGSVAKAAKVTIE